MTTISEAGVTAGGLFYSDEVVAATLPVTGWAGEGLRIIARVITGPLHAGNLVDADGWGRAVSRMPYLVGVAAHLWGYDADGEGETSERPWWRLGRSFGDNVTPDRKYLPFGCGAVWQVPDGWPAGHRMVVVLRADAHSTAATSGDEVEVGANGWVRARVWS